jgi:hypothetical protein
MKNNDIREREGEGWREGEEERGREGEGEREREELFQRAEDWRPCVSAPSFSPVFCLCFSAHLGFTSSLRQLAWD